MRASIGIVIPARNTAATIGATITALRAASGIDADILVVDGESTDTTVSIARSLGANVVSRPPCGVYEAVNFGLAAVHGDWLTYINADDVLYADVLADRLSAAAGYDVAYGPVDFVDQSGRHLHQWLSARPGFLLSVYRAGMSPLLQQGTIFRREVFDCLKGFDTRWQLVSDSDFWFRALERGFRFYRSTAQPAAAFRMHAQQLGRVRAADSRSEHAAMSAMHGNYNPWPGRMAALVWRASNWRSYVYRAARFRPGIDGLGSLDSYALGPP